MKMPHPATIPSTRFQFGHREETIRFWRVLVNRALESHDTPFYLLSIEPVRDALRELDRLGPGLAGASGIARGSVPANPGLVGPSAMRRTRSARPLGGRELRDQATSASPPGDGWRVRHWLSCKTQPVGPLLRWWRNQGHSIEVVSEFELLAALKEGFPPGRILVNGPAKHEWLHRHSVRGLFVNFDSPNEAKALASLARKLDWGVGVRIHTAEEFDPENPESSTQFGMPRAEALTALESLKRQNARIETVHFHLRTHVASPDIYERALNEVADICRAARFAPKYVDCGGGLPPPNVLSHNGRAFDSMFHLDGLARVYARALAQFPGIRELWLENGRFVSARSGVLVVRVRDLKQRQGLRHLICDGGRTTQALLSNWETHAILAVPARRGPLRPTAVCGPTCMAFDRLALRDLPLAVRPGDRLVWMDAGAYHIPWETRFSHGYAKVLWHEGREITVARQAESFESWWGQWERRRPEGPKNPKTGLAKRKVHE
jgi:diaminopimelate decarboxylase